VIAGDLAAAAPWIGRIFGPGPAAVLGEEPARRVVLLGAFAHAGEAVAAGTLAARLGSGPADTAVIVAALRARLAGRAVNLPVLAEADRAGLDAAVEALRGARYGVVLCDAATLDDLALDLVAGLVADLNRAGRFALLPFPGADDAAGAALVHAWTTGFMPPVGFRGGRVRHDAWEFSAARMIEHGEADLLVWISAMSPTPPAWTSVPTVALVAPGTRLSVTPEVVVTVAPPAAGAVVHDAFAASLVALAEPEPHPSLPTVAAVLAGVAAEIAGGVA
jgi:formylmethanofuran dehydrogenase subunit B